ncbi:MAG TPA: AMP-binding protein, partial [Pyrinomonadaceae bacterium]
DHFQTLLEGIVANPDQRLSALPLLRDSERKALLSGWNTATSNCRDCSIHDLIQEQAERSPQATAVVFENRALTYAELNDRANQVAHALRRANVSADVCVGLLVDRSVEMLVGLLGILKAGGAYVPLNPNHPKETLVLQLERANAPILITQERYLSPMAGYPGRTFCLDRDRLLLESEEKSNPKWTTDPQDLAYVIFTSGSTGTPKGVAVTHQNLVNYTEFICDRLKLDRGKLNFATTTTIAADLGNTCIFPSLVSGGSLHVLSYETTTDSARFAEYMTDHSIDVLKIVPSHLNSLLASEKGHSILPRKYLISGGEALSWELAMRIRELKPDCEVINHYGPTEATIGSLTFTLSQ